MSEATEKRAHDDAQMRAKFEAWAIKQRNQHGVPYFVLWNPDCDEYVDQTTNDAWAGWKASRAAVLEEAAAMVSVYLADHEVEQARELLPDAIRALASAEG